MLPNSIIILLQKKNTYITVDCNMEVSCASVNLFESEKSDILKLCLGFESRENSSDQKEPIQIWLLRYDFILSIGGSWWLAWLGCWVDKQQICV